jgi:trk system potassium uptake protein TrkH
MGRHLNRDLVRSAGLLIVLAILWNLVGVVLLAFFERGRPEMELQNLLFEQISAFGTVGLSTGITPSLSTMGRLIVMLTIFTGRVGLLTVAFALTRRQQPANYRYPEERILVG